MSGERSCRDTFGKLVICLIEIIQVLEYLKSPAF